MTNPTSYTDEQVLEHAEWQTGETRKMLLSLHADRRRLQAELDLARAGLSALMTMDVKGFQLQDRLQFSTPSRELLGKCLVALGKSNPYEATPNETEIAELREHLINGSANLIANPNETKEAKS